MSEPAITIESPFPLMEIPALFCWVDRVRLQVADDQVPSTLKEWMDYQDDLRESPGHQDWGIYRGGELGGYLHLITVEPFGDDYDRRVCDELRWTGQAELIFKGDIWGFLPNARPAVNLALETIFETGTETVFFPVLSHNRVLKKLFTSAGGISIGQITPRKQNGVEVPTEMFCFTATQWEARNPEVLNQPQKGANQNGHGLSREIETVGRADSSPAMQ